MIDLTKDPQGKVKARLLDLVPGRSGNAYADWLEERGEAFRRGMKVAALDPFQGHKTAIDDKLEDAVAVLDAFHIVKLGTAAVDECRRIQQEPLGHRGRKGDPLYSIQNLLGAGAEKLTDKQWTRLENAIAARPDEHRAVYIAWTRAEQLRSAYRHPNPAEGRMIAFKVLESLPTCPVPEIASLGRTLKPWREPCLAYLDTGRSSNGGTEAINGLNELHRRVARGFRNYDNYCLRMLLLIGGGLTGPTSIEKSRISRSARLTERVTQVIVTLHGHSVLYMDTSVGRDHRSA